MNILLLRSCAALWIVGMLVMWFARAVLALAPDALLFQLAGGSWILGGLGYTGLALLSLVSPDLGERSSGPGRAAVPADLSSWIRRR